MPPVAETVLFTFPLPSSRSDLTISKPNTSLRMDSMACWISRLGTAKTYLSETRNDKWKRIVATRLRVTELTNLSKTTYVSFSTVHQHSGRRSTIERIFSQLFTSNGWPLRSDMSPSYLFQIILVLWKSAAD